MATRVGRVNNPHPHNYAQRALVTSDFRVSCFHLSQAIWELFVSDTFESVLTRNRGTKRVRTQPKVERHRNVLRRKSTS